MHGNFRQRRASFGLEGSVGAAGHYDRMSRIGGMLKEGEDLRDEVECTSKFQLSFNLTLYSVFGSQCGVEYPVAQRPFQRRRISVEFEACTTLY